MAGAADRARSLLIGDVDRRRAARRCGSGPPVICNKSREVTVVGAVSLGRASAVRRVVGDGRRPGDRVGAASLVAVLVAVYLATTLTAAIKSEEAFLRRDVRRSVRSLSQRRRRERRGRRRVARRSASRRRSRTASTARSPGWSSAILLLIWKATYNGAFWRAAGTQRSGGRLAQW